MNAVIRRTMRTMAVLATTTAIASGSLAAQERGTVTLGGYAQHTGFDEHTRLTGDNAWGLGGFLGVFVAPNLSLEGAAGRSWTEDASPAGVDGTWTPLRARLVWNAPMSSWFYPLLGAGVVRNNYDDAVDGADTGMFGLVGFKAYLSQRVAFRGDFSLDYMPSPFNEGEPYGAGTIDRAHTNWTATAGLSIDLVRGRAMDSDGDGVRDRLDQCPDTPLGVQVDSMGCRVDSDRDGVYDEDDACPNTPAGVAVDSRGCRVDSDDDGVYDEDDACPNTPAGVAVDSRGCRVDSDGDGVYDDDDACPNTPAGVAVDSRGCEIVEEAPAPPLVLEDVHFGFDSAELRQEARSTLDRVAESLRGNPGVRIRVVGHTDNSGSEVYNVTLSERRARAVADYLSSQGINANRFEVEGRGPSQPAVSNETRGGREANRRAELERIGG